MTLCCCKCHQPDTLPPEQMQKWTLVKEIEKYGKLKYATNRPRQELIDILHDLKNGDSSIMIIDGVILLRNPEKRLKMSS